jgi:hypothetical protein
MIVSFIVFAAVQGHAGLTITPARYEGIVAPGKSCEGVYTVRNDFPTKTEVIASFRDWFILPENNNIPISGWISIKPNEFLLKPGESKDVHFTVHVPTAAKGVSVAMFSFSPRAEKNGITSMMSVSLYITVAGTEKIGWEINDIKLDKSSSEFKMTAQVQNKGNVHVRPSGTVTINSANKDLVFAMIIPEGRPVYPGAIRSIKASSTAVSALTKGEYSAIVKVSGDGEEKIKNINFIINDAGELIIK